MKTTLMILIGIISFASCTTPYDLKRTKPVVSYVSAKSINDIKKCILKKWRAHTPNVLEEKTSHGVLIRHNDVLPNATVAIVTIEGTEPEVSVNYYHRTDKIHLYQLEEEVNSCK